MIDIFLKQIGSLLPDAREMRLEMEASGPFSQVREMRLAMGSVFGFQLDEHNAYLLNSAVSIAEIRHYGEYTGVVSSVYQKDAEGCCTVFIKSTGMIASGRKNHDVKGHDVPGLKVDVPGRDRADHHLTEIPQMFLHFSHMSCTVTMLHTRAGCVVSHM